MDKITKALNKLNSNEKRQINAILDRLEINDWKNLDIKKLVGRDDVYRVRKGNVRIIFRISQDKEIYILTIERRNDNTYRY